jgi:hypothetical protein
MGKMANRLLIAWRAYRRWRLREPVSHLATLRRNAYRKCQANLNTLDGWASHENLVAMSSNLSASGRSITLCGQLSTARRLPVASTTGHE